MLCRSSIFAMTTITAFDPPISSNGEDDRNRNRLRHVHRPAHRRHTGRAGDLAAHQCAFTTDAASPDGNQLLTTHAIPLLTVPATVEAAAILSEWLVRSLLPSVLDGAGMVEDADSLCALAPITARRLARPRRLHKHERQLDRIIATIEERLQSQPPVPVVTAAVHADPHVRPIPTEILDVAAHIGGAIADIGSSAAALANRALHLGAVVVDAGLGATTAEHLRTQVTESYCSLLTYLWHTDPNTEIQWRELR